MRALEEGGVVHATILNWVVGGDLIKLTFEQRLERAERTCQGQSRVDCFRQRHQPK